MSKNDKVLEKENYIFSYMKVIFFLILITGYFNYL